MHDVVERVDLGPCPAVAFHAGPRWAIVLPGAGYGVQAPLLWYARRAAMATGRSVLTVVDAYESGGDAVAWVESRASSALDHVRPRDGRPVLIAKSISSLASGLAAREGLPGVWITPLIAVSATAAAPAVLAGLRAAPAPSLIIGGSVDPTWDAAAIVSIEDAQVVELPGADHSLEVPDLAASVRNLEQVAESVRRFIDGLG